MKKNFLRAIFSFLLTISVFGILNVSAKENAFIVTDINIKEKSEKVFVYNVSLNNGTIKNDIVFTDINDYITYNITIKNTKEEDLIIKSIKDDNTVEQLSYTYDDLKNVKVEAGMEKTFNLTIKYNSLKDSLTITDKPINLTLTYENDKGEEIEEVITNNIEENNTNNAEIKENNNPKTSDSLYKYILIGFISIIGFVMASNKKKNTKYIVLISILSIIIPLNVKADADSFNISISSNRIRNSYSKLVSGRDFNTKVNEISSGKELTMNCSIIEDTEQCILRDSDNNVYINNIIKAIKRATYSEYEQVIDNLSDNNIVSTEESTVPTYIWYDNEIIYYYTPANIIVLDEDCSFMFAFLTTVETIELDTLDSSLVNSLAYMFSFNSSLKEIDLSHFNTENVINMEWMFSGCSSITDITFGNINTENVTNMRGLFSDCSSLETIDLSNLDTDNVTNMSYMFSYNTSLKDLDLSAFTTSNVTNMRNMFADCSSLENVILTSFDTSNVTNMAFMFLNCSSLKELDLSSIDSSNIPDYTGFYSIFDNCTELTTIYASNKLIYNLPLNGNSSVVIFKNTNKLVGGKGTHYPAGLLDKRYFRIDDPDNNKPGYFTDIADKQ